MSKVKPIKRRLLIGCAAIFGVLVVLGLIAAFVELPLYVFRLPKSEWANYRAWRKVSWPKELNLMQVTPYSDELRKDAWTLVALYRQFPDEMKALTAVTQDKVEEAAEDDYDYQDESSDVFEDGMEEPDSALNSIGPEMLDLAESLSSSFQPVLGHPEFDLDVLHSHFSGADITPSLGLCNLDIYKFHMAAAAAHALLALKQMSEDEPAAALEYLDTMRRILKFDPYADFFQFAVRRSATQNYVKNMATVLKASPDPEIAQLLIGALGDLRLPARDAFAFEAHYDPVGRARYFLKRGFDMSFETGADMALVGMPYVDPSSAYLLTELGRMRTLFPKAALEIEAFQEKYPEYAAPRFSTEPFSYDALVDPWGPPHPMRMVWKALNAAIVFDVTELDHDSKFNRQDNERRRLSTNVQIDLLLIHAANVLFTAKSGKAARAWTELSPDFLPAPLPDPFSADGSPYRLEPEPRSVGPDGKTNPAEYDPQNGFGYVNEDDLLLEYSADCVRNWRSYLEAISTAATSSPPSNSPAAADR